MRTMGVRRSQIFLAALGVLWAGAAGAAALTADDAVKIALRKSTDVINSAAGVKATGRAYQKAALTMGAGRLLRFRRVTFPGALPYLLLGCRIGLGVGWMVIVSAEMVGAQSGLGFLIMKARSFARIDWVVNCMIVIGLIGLALDAAIVRVQRWTVPWWGKVAA